MLFVVVAMVTVTTVMKLPLLLVTDGTDCQVEHDKLVVDEAGELVRHAHQHVVQGTVSSRCSHFVMLLLMQSYE